MGLVRAVEGIRMPDYHGDAATGKHVVSVAWRVDGILPDGRVFIVRVAVGFAFDGCSIPRALWRVCGHPMEVPRVAAALAHDWLYAAHVCDRATADEIFREVCKLVGLGAIRRNVEYYALRVAGGSAWNSHGADDQEFARAHGALELDGKIQKGEIEK